MPQVHIYLSEELAVSVKRHKLPVSTICQQALRAEITAAQQRPGAIQRFREAMTNQEAK